MIQQAKEITSFEAHENYVIALQFTQDDQTLISSGMDKTIKLWSTEKYELIKTLQAHENSVNAISLSPDQELLASGSSDQTVKLWAFPAGEELFILRDRKQVVSTVKFSPDGKLIAAGSYGGRVMVWTRAGKPVVAFRASKKNLSSISFSPNGTYLAVCGLGPQISIWSIPDGKTIAMLDADDVAVGALQFIDQGRKLVSQNYNGGIKIWNSETWDLIDSYHPATSPVRGMVFSPDETTLVLSLESKVQFWDWIEWRMKLELPVSTKALNGMSFSHDGKLFALGAADRKIRIWELN